MSEISSSLSNIAYFRTDGGSSKLYTQEYVNEKDKEIDRLNNIINELYEFVEWHYKDNKKFFKNKGIGLNYPECDYVLDKLKELKENNK